MQWRLFFTIAAYKSDITRDFFQKEVIQTKSLLNDVVT